MFNILTMTYLKHDLKHILKEFYFLPLLCGKTRESPHLIMLESRWNPQGSHVIFTLEISVNSPTITPEIPHMSQGEGVVDAIDWCIKAPHMYRGDRINGTTYV